MAEGPRTRPADAARLPRDNILIWQVALVAGLLAAWEIAGRLTGADQVSSPSRIMQTIMIWLRGELYPHLFTTLGELACGMAIGCSLGILAGLVLGRMPIVSLILRPIIVGLYSVPLVTLAPLFRSSTESYTRPVRPVAERELEGASARQVAHPLPHRTPHHQQQCGDAGRWWADDGH